MRRWLAAPVVLSLTGVAGAQSGNGAASSVGQSTATTPTRIGQPPQNSAMRQAGGAGAMGASMTNLGASAPSAGGTNAMTLTSSGQTSDGTSSATSGERAPADADAGRSAAPQVDANGITRRGGSGSEAPR